MANRYINPMQTSLSSEVPITSSKQVKRPNNQLFMKDMDASVMGRTMRSASSSETERVAKGLAQLISRKKKHSREFDSQSCGSWPDIKSKNIPSTSSIASKRSTSGFPHRAQGFNSSTSSEPENAPTFVIPKRTTPARDEKMHATNEIIHSLRNTNPTGVYGAIVRESDGSNKTPQVLVGLRTMGDIDPFITCFSAPDNKNIDFF